MVEILKYHSRSSGLRCTFPLVPVELPPPVRNRGESGITLAKNHWQPLSRFENNNNFTISTLFLLQFVLCDGARKKRICHFQSISCAVAEITVWINILVKHHKWHRKINPINIIVRCVLELFRGWSPPGKEIEWVRIRYKPQKSGCMHIYQVCCCKHE